MSIPTSSTLLSADKLDALKATVSQELPVPSAKLMARNKWIQYRIVNQTQFKILLQLQPTPQAGGKYYFKEGVTWDLPGDTNPFSTMDFSATQNVGSPYGIKGGNSFSISIDDENSYKFSIGWTYESGRPPKTKSGVIESKNLKEMREIIMVTKEGGNAIQSVKYTGKDENGNPLTMQLNITALPAFPKYPPCATFMYIISQEIVKEEEASATTNPSL